MSHEIDGDWIAAGDAAERVVDKIAEQRNRPEERAMTNAVVKMENAEGQAAPTAITPMDMLDRAVSQGANIETLERLVALEERWRANEARKAFDSAIAEAKGEIPTIRKNRTVDFTSSKGRTHYKHEDLAEIAATINPILKVHGLSYRFRTTAEINQPIVVTCILSHRQGYSEETTLSAPRDDSGNKNAIQQVGSTLTYLQRMTLKAALGLAAAEDDDGRKSGGDSAEPISRANVEKLLTLIDETETDIAKFCQYMGVEAVPEITTTALPRALSMLEKKKAKAHA